MATFADRLRHLRKEKRITQEKLAEIFFITKSAVSKYETGINTPENKLLQDIADFFEVSVDYLLGRTDERILKSERLSKANSLKDELIELMMKRGIIKDKNSINDEHLKLIEMSISTYADRTNNKKQGDEN
jgi:transcriptional regulator with XRE-family HTH domain